MALNTHFSSLTGLEGLPSAFVDMRVIEKHNSPRVNGKLVLRKNPLNYSVTRYSMKSDQKSFHRNWLNPSYDNYSDRSAYWWYNSLIESNPAFTWPGLPDNSLQDAAVRKFYSKLNVQVINLGEIIHTRQMTVNMVVSAIERIANAGLALRRGDIRRMCGYLGISYRKPSLKNGTSNVPSLWLEYQYGWKPLLGDIYNFLDSTFPDPSLRIQASKSKSFPLTYDGHQYDSYIHNVRGSCRQRVSLSARVFIDNAQLSAISHYGLNNPLSVAWEIVPFSFVVDWFLPVGPYLEMLNPFGALRIDQVSFVKETTFGFTDVGTWPEVPFDGYYYNKQVTPARFELKSKIYERSVSLPPLPLPSVKNPLSLQHAANALSLLTQVFSGKKIANTRYSI